jgi:hypothetical protein
MWWHSSVVEIAGVAVLALTLLWPQHPRALLALVLTMFGCGQGLVMAPSSSAVLSSVQPASAGPGSGMYGTTAQVANAAGVAAIGAVFFGSKPRSRHGQRCSRRRACLRCRSSPVLGFWPACAVPLIEAIRHNLADTC